MNYEERKEKYAREIFGDMEKAFFDKGHPGFHLTPPSHFMIDFWGSYFDGEKYHIMCHVCPKRGGMQDETVFFHAASDDLLNWKWFSPPIITLDDELRLNDGFIAKNGKGEIIMIYTSVPKDSSIPRTHWAAMGSDDLMRFDRLPMNPILTLQNHGGPKFGNGWSDPYIFENNGRTYMLMSKCVDETGKDRMPIYEATDDTLLNWKYRGIFLDDNGEVVNFFRIGEKWVLLMSPYRAPEYYVGDFDEVNFRFVPKTHGILSYGYFSQGHGTPVDRGFYATCIYLEGKWKEQRRIACGWISGFEDNEFWNGCMSIPREIGINEKDEVTQMPIEEIKALRGERFFAENTAIFEAEVGNSLDIELVYEGDELLLELDSDFSMRVTNSFFELNGRKYECELFFDEYQKRIRILIDKSFAEVFFGDGSVSGTRCFSPLSGNARLTVKAQKIVKLKCYKMRKAEIK